MAAAIRKISIARGHDVTRYTLACFGGAGGQHACRVADALGMERILIHPLAGVLSAYGIGLADVKAIREASWLKPLGEDFQRRRWRRWKRRRATRPGRRRASTPTQIAVDRRARLRTPGSDTTHRGRNRPAGGDARRRSTRCTASASAMSTTSRADRRRAGGRGGRAPPRRGAMRARHGATPIEPASGRLHRGDLAAARRSTAPR